MDETTTILIGLSHGVDYELRYAMARYDYDGRVQVSRFRSADLESYAQQTFPESCHTQFSESVELAFKGFVNARRKLVGGELPSDELVTAELSRPKSILVVDWEGSLFDGAVTPETEGFIDDDCMPGWDSWLTLADVPTSHGKKCLICWVPEELAEKVNFGVSVDAASCMSWLKVNQNGGMSLVGWGRSVS
ncbi:MAG: hypothetical protein KF847_17100 [Pirellulales bacterium]|nr:hypothetical protein [Pirellulales bacterium]